MEDEIFNEKQLALGFVNLVGQEEDGKYRYEFIFTDNPDEFWGDDFENKPAGLMNNLMPSEEYKTETHIVRTEIKFDLIQNNGCFGMQDCLDGVVSLCYSNSEYEGETIFFNFGETFYEVQKKLAQNNILIS